MWLWKSLWDKMPSGKVAVQYVPLLLGIAIVGQLSYAGFTPVKNIAFSTTENIAGIIGVAGTVAPNDFNTLAAELKQKEDELKLREQALLDGRAASSSSDRITLYVLVGITGLLLVLLLLNFYLDWKRGEHNSEATPAYHDEFTTRL